MTHCFNCNLIEAKYCTWQDPFAGIILCQLCSEYRRGDAGDEEADLLNDKINKYRENKYES
jgi:hypothetical protein